MWRFSPYLGIFFALLLGASLAFFVETFNTPSLPVSDFSIASSTLSVVPEPSSLPVTLPEEAKQEVVATSTAQKVPVKETQVEPKKSPVPIPQTVIPQTSVVIPSPAPTASSGIASLDVAASVLRGAIVNIICFAPEGGTLRSISGSGVFIDSKGIILTNAHVAQHFLLADRGVSCKIRSGSPAVNAYEAALIYFPSAWVQANPDVLTKTLPMGNGEHDFALLAVTKSATAAALPAVFPSVRLAEPPPSSGTPVVIATYGAQFLEISQIQSFLFPTVVFGSVKDVFTFKTNTIDVLALGGSAAAQEGSSGGGVADASGALVGVITTSTVEGATDTRSLSAITASYIRGAYASGTGNALDILLSKPLMESIAAFAPNIPALEAIITANLP